ncbi:DNA topoisomerase IV subunit A [Acidithiobacillus ferrivorans]|nr:DNA topoisomerase IV subunit A [Acidithiobacillus ferrivorans]
MSTDTPVQTDIFDLFYFGVGRGPHAPETDTKNTGTDIETGTSPPGVSLMVPLFPEDPITTAGTPPPSPPGSTPPSIPDGIPPLAEFARNAYLAYAMSVVTGRAIPSLADGQKPVQRRILFAMRDMGLQRSPKHVKSARVVGEVIGKWHPHGDSSVYEAMVRMAQDFTLRYPLVDGQGNFGSRDGDSAAAMRYTESQITKISDLLLGELDEGTIDFHSNYDGTLQEPALLPARLPFLLLNGASGIAVGMATEIPPHNLTEVATLAARLVEFPDMTTDEILSAIPGPDFPGGGQLISEPEDIRQAYCSGRGSLRVRARWTVDKMAQGQWRIVIHEIPPGVSTAMVLAEIEALSNPQPKGGSNTTKKTITAEQQSAKTAYLSQIDTVRDESGKAHAVRLVIEPKSRNQSPEDLMRMLLATTSLETNVSINLTVLDLDGRAPCMPMPDILRQWVFFRVTTVRRRSEFRLNKLLARMHILEGRLRVLLDIDAVIRVIRESDDPKADLITHFQLTEIQAEDILEIRLRQLARLAGIEIERELADKQTAAAHLQTILADDQLLRAMVAAEIRADAETFGDARRTIVEPASRVRADEPARLADEPVTVIVSRKGWLRARNGHHLDITGLTFKEGDGLMWSAEARTTDTLILIDAGGRAYSIPVAQLPGGKGDGIPASSQVDFQGPNPSIRAAACGALDSQWLVASTGGYGFIASVENMAGRNRAGKAFLVLGDKESPLPFLRVSPDTAEIAAISSDGRGLVFATSEVKAIPKGKGVKLMHLVEGATLKSLQWVIDGKAAGFGRGRLAACAGKRGGTGRKA